MLLAKVLEKVSEWFGELFVDKLEKTLKNLFNLNRKNEKSLLNGTWLFGVFDESKEMFAAICLQENIQGDISVSQPEEFYMAKLKNINKIDTTQSKVTTISGGLKFDITPPDMKHNAVAWLEKSGGSETLGNDVWSGRYVKFPAESGDGIEQKRAVLARIKDSDRFEELIEYSIKGNGAGKTSDINTNIDISIVVTTYNAGNKVRECLNSIKTACDRANEIKTEVIVIDDGSLDNTESVLSEYRDMAFRPIKILHRGTNFARNVGLRQAQGKYIMFLDSKDVIKEEIFEHLREKLLKETVGIMIGGYEEESPVSAVIKYQVSKELCTNYPMIEFAKSRSKLQILRLGSAAGKLYNNTIIKKNDIKFEEHCFGDTCFNIAVQTYIDKVVVDASVWIKQGDKTGQAYRDDISMTDYLAGQMIVYIRYVNAIKNMEKLCDEAKKKCIQEYSYYISQKIMDKEAMCRRLVG